MLKGTLNSSQWLIRTKKLYSDGDELSVVYCKRHMCVAMCVPVQAGVLPGLPCKMFSFMLLSIARTEIAGVYRL